MGLNLNINIQNPLFKGKYTFKQLFSFEKKITKNKFISINFDKSTTSDLFSLDLDINLTGRDHAGIGLGGNIGSLFANFEIRDSRHWDYENNCWKIDFSSWFDLFQKYLYKINEGIVVHENNVIKYYNDNVNPLDAVNRFVKNNNLEEYMSPSRSGMIPGKFVHESSSDNKVVLHKSVLKYFDSIYIDVTKNGNIIPVTFMEFNITNNDIYSEYIGHCEKYKNYVELDRKYIADFSVLIGEKSSAVVRLLLNQNSPYFDYSSIISPDVGTMPIKIIKECISHSSSGYVPKFYYLGGV